MTANLDTGILLFPKMASIAQVIALVEIMGSSVCRKIRHVGHHLSDNLPVRDPVTKCWKSLETDNIWPVVFQASPNLISENSIDMEKFRATEEELGASENDALKLFENLSSAVKGARKYHWMPDSFSYEGKGFLPNDTIMLRFLKLEKVDLSLDESKGFLLA